MLFGTKRLRTLGSDLGTAIKGFRTSIKSDDATQDAAKEDETAEQTDKPAD
jgi:sec-independent protein translocase protein TatA